jgi:hypothetical protein
MCTSSLTQSEDNALHSLTIKSIKHVMWHSSKCFNQLLKEGKQREIIMINNHMTVKSWSIITWQSNLFVINLCLSSSNNQKLQQKKLKEEKATCRCDQVIHNYGASETLCLTKQSSHNLTRGSHKPVSLTFRTMSTSPPAQDQ